MFERDGMQNINDDGFFELWTKELKEELSAFWAEIIE